MIIAEKTNLQIWCLCHIFFTKTFVRVTGLVFSSAKKWQKFTKEKNGRPKSYFSGPRKSKMWQTSLTSCCGGLRRGQRQIYVCVALHSFIYFNGQSEPAPTGTPRKTHGRWIANTFSVVF
jgi:hypothetical protein